MVPITVAALEERAEALSALKGRVPSVGATGVLLKLTVMAIRLALEMIGALLTEMMITTGLQAVSHLEKFGGT